MDLWIKKLKGDFLKFWNRWQYLTVSLAVVLCIVGMGIYVLNASAYQPLQDKVCRLMNWEMQAYEVVVNNKKVGIVENADVASEAWNEAVSSLNSGETKYHIYSDYQVVQTTAKPSEFSDKAQLEQPFEAYLNENISNYTVTGYTLQIGDLSFVFQTKEEIYELFERLAQNCLGNEAAVTCSGIQDGQPVYTLEKTVTVSDAAELKNNAGSAVESSDTESSELLRVEVPYTVGYQMIYTREQDLTTVDAAFEVCTGESVVEKEYTVTSGDSLSYIARKNDLSIDELLALNPGYTISSMIHAGDIFCVQASEPNVAVYRVMREVYERYDDPPIEYQYDDTKYTNYYKVIDEGKKAKVKVEDLVSYDGEIEVKREEISTEVLEEPEVQVVVRGTMPLPQFIWPTHGIITTNFGLTWDEFRNGQMHYGLDIANRAGTYIYSSAAGKVIRAGWYGSYGYCVIIDHQNGFQTLYGHCSSLDVSVGQWVEQSQLIARMGTTGKSSGNHCHFEIIYYGTKINPYKYLD